MLQKYMMAKEFYTTEKQKQYGVVGIRIERI